jgi:hypothetical protein
MGIIGVESVPTSAILHGSLASGKLLCLANKEPAQGEQRKHS